MEEDNYYEYIDDEMSDIEAAANRYNSELEKLNTLFERSYPSITDASTAGAPAFSALYYHNEPYSVIDLHEMKNSLDLLREEVRDLKKMLQPLAKAQQTKEYRKITL
jgi:prefoldin subunit 5